MGTWCADGGAPRAGALDLDSLSLLGCDIPRMHARKFGLGVRFAASACSLAEFGSSEELALHRCIRRARARSLDLRCAAGTVQSALLALESFPPTLPRCLV